MQIRQVYIWAESTHEAWHQSALRPGKGHLPVPRQCFNNMSCGHINNVLSNAMYCQTQVSMQSSQSGLPLAPAADAGFAQHSMHACMQEQYDPTYRQYGAVYTPPWHWNKGSSSYLRDQDGSLSTTCPVELQHVLQGVFTCHITASR